MVAIRGTQLGGTAIEEQNDLCAYWWLLEERLSDFCDQFTEDQMNYLKQLEQFPEEVRT